MLTKRTRGNQITIPKKIVRDAGLTEDDVYFDVACRDGTILLTPVQIEFKIPPRAYEKLLRSAFHIEPGDKVATDAQARRILAKRGKRR